MNMETIALAGALYAWLRENPGQGVREIRKQFGIDDNRIERILLVAQDCGILFYEEKVDHPNGTNKAGIKYFSYVDGLGGER